MPSTHFPAFQQELLSKCYITEVGGWPTPLQSITQLKTQYILLCMLLISKTLPSYCPMFACSHPSNKEAQKRCKEKNAAIEVFLSIRISLASLTQFLLQNNVFAQLYSVTVMKIYADVLGA